MSKVYLLHIHPRTPQSPSSPAVRRSFSCSICQPMLQLFVARNADIRTYHTESQRRQDRVPVLLEILSSRRRAASARLRCARPTPGSGVRGS